MAKKKKDKWPYKFVRKDTVEELQGLSYAELLERVLGYDTNVKAETMNKKRNTVIKENSGTINKHRKQYVSTSKAFEDARLEFEHQKELRDEDILEFIEEKADMEKGYNEAINGFKEHFSVAMKILKERR